MKPTRPVSVPDQGSSATRAEAMPDRRQRILEAARQRFVEQGFHAATMESIARQAGVSAGLSYRYFDNKRALVLALIERHLQWERQGIAEMPPDTTAQVMVEHLLAIYQERGMGEMDAVLFSEITLAGARDPQVAAVLQQAETQSRADFVALLEAYDRMRGIPGDAGDIRVRALIMGHLISGLLVRCAREPELDPAILRQVFERVVALVLK